MEFGNIISYIILYNCNIKTKEKSETKIIFLLKKLKSNTCCYNIRYKKLKTTNYNNYLNSIY